MFLSISEACIEDAQIFSNMQVLMKVISKEGYMEFLVHYLLEENLQMWDEEIPVER